MKIVGLTGGIACGKSSVSRELQLVHGFPVVDADEIAHVSTNLMRQGQAQPSKGVDLT